IFSNTITMQRDGIMLRLREKVIALEAMVSRAAVDLKAAQAKIAKLTTELNAQTAARAAAEQSLEVLSETNRKLQTCIDDLHTELKKQHWQRRSKQPGKLKNVQLQPRSQPHP